MYRDSFRFVFFWKLYSSFWLACSLSFLSFTFISYPWLFLYALLFVLFCFMNTYHVDLFCSYPTLYVFIYYYNLSMWFVFFVSFSFLARDVLTYNVYLYFSVQNVVSLMIIFYYQKFPVIYILNVSFDMFILSMYIWIIIFLLYIFSFCAKI